MSFKDQMKELQKQNTNAEFKENRVVKLDSSKYDEFVNKVCRVLEDDMKKKIFHRNFLYDHGLFSKKNYRYESHGEFGLSIRSDSFSANDYMIEQIDTSGGYNEYYADGIVTCYWEDILQVYKKIVLRLQEDDFDDLTMNISTNPILSQNDIISILKKCTQKNIQGNYYASCMVYVKVVLNCTNTGEI